MDGPGFSLCATPLLVLDFEVHGRGQVNKLRYGRILDLSLSEETLEREGRGKDLHLSWE